MEEGKFIINDQAVTITGGTILEDIVKSGFLIPHSCADGRCKSCEIQSSDKPTKKLLACQEVPSPGESYYCANFESVALPKSTTFFVKLDDIKYVGNFFEITLKYSPSVNFDYFPGQYLKIFYGNESRSYSIFNVKRKTNQIVLILTPVDNGMFTKILSSVVNIGERFKVTLPLGNFFLRNSDFEKKKIFICSGSGISPILNMIKILSAEERQNVKIYWIIRHKCEFSDLIKTELRSLIEIFCTRDLDQTTKYHTGRPDLKFIISGVSNAQLYVAGNPLLIDDVVELCKLYSVNQKNIFLDYFSKSY